VVGDFLAGVDAATHAGEMLGALGDYAGEVRDGAQAAWDHAEENDDRYKSGDILGGLQADTAFLGGFAQRSSNVGCGGRWAARQHAKWLRDLNPRAFDRGYRAAPFGDAVIDTGALAVAPAMLEERIALASEQAAARRLAAAEAEGLIPRARLVSDPNELRQYAISEAERLLQSGMSKTERGPVVSVIEDTLTGDRFTGFNRVGSASPVENLHPTLEARLGEFERLVDTGRIRPLREGELPSDFPDAFTPRVQAGVPGSHSEIDALNQALWARQRAGLPAGESALLDLSLYNIWTKPNKAFGQPAPRCDNCWFMTLGVRVLSGR